MIRVRCFTITVILLTACLYLSAQDTDALSDPWDDEKFFNIGYSLGFNAMMFRVTPSEQYLATDSLHAGTGSLYPGINIHLAVNFRLNQFFDIRLLPGISFGQRMVTFESDRLTDTVFSPQKIESSFIELPLLLKYGWRMNEIKPYVIAGGNFRYDFYAQEKYRLERPVYLRLSRPDIYFEVGTGIEFYLSQIKLGIELKYSGGFNDVLVHDPHPDYPQYCNSIEKLKSHIWVLSFHFE
jgi:hypothetical protein